MRTKAIYLTEAQMWKVAKYCIENKGVSQGPDGKFTNFRVVKGQLAKECSKDLFNVTPHGIDKSIIFYNTVCELTNNLAIVPPQESVEATMLKIEQEKLNKNIETLEKAVSDLAATNKLLTARISNYQERLSQVAKLAKV